MYPNVFMQHVASFPGQITLKQSLA